MSGKLWQERQKELLTRFDWWSPLNSRRACPRSEAWCVLLVVQRKNAHALFKPRLVHGLRWIGIGLPLRKQWLARWQNGGSSPGYLAVRGPLVLGSESETIQAGCKI